MNILFKNIFSLGMSLILFASTVGVSLNTVYCFCKKEFRASLFEINDTCESAPQIASCCKSKKVCLQKEEKKHQCTKKGKKLIILDTDFLTNDVKFVHVDFSIGQLFHTKTTIPTFVNQKFYPKKTNKAPPWLQSGQSIRIFTQSFLC